MRERVLGVLAVTAVIGTLGLAGCGGSEDGSGAPGTTAAPAVPTAAAAAATTDELSDMDFTMLGGARFTRNPVGDFDGTIRVRNDGESRGGFFDVELSKDGAVVGTLSGLLPSIDAGATVTVRLASTDPYSPGPYEVRFTAGTL